MFSPATSTSTSTNAATTITIQEEEAVPLSSSSLPSAVQVIPFAVRLPPSVFTLAEKEEPSSSRRILQNPQLTALLLESGVVGTITVLNKSVLVWFGWGKLQLGSGGAANNALLPRMGPFIMSMPRTQYQGAFNHAEASCTKLVGSAAEEEELLCRQMAARLAAKLQSVAVVCSCSFAGPAPAAQGMDPTLLQHKAAAFAEKHVGAILRDLQAKGKL